MAGLRSVLLVGSGPRARSFAQAMAGRGGVELVGSLDDCPLDYPGAPRYLGTLGDLPRVLSSTVIDEVLVTLPMRSGYERILETLRHCEQQGVPAMLPADLFPLQRSRPRGEVLHDLPIMRVSDRPPRDWRFAVKRALDVAGSATLLLALAPVLALVALAVRATSPGPVIFSQVRVGWNKRPFRFYKFRTMVQDAEAKQAALEALNEASGPVFKIRRDPRITPVGGWLRRTSLDELPQLFNVLLGDMSLVGPRPLPLRDVSRFEEHWQRRRFSVRPGITCLWQLSGRSDLSFERWMALDLEYIDRWSLWLDLTLLARTPAVVFRRQGAY